MFWGDFIDQLHFGQTLADPDDSFQLPHCYGNMLFY